MKRRARAGRKPCAETGNSRKDYWCEEIERVNMASNIINMAVETQGHDLERRGEEYAPAPLAERINAVSKEVSVHQEDITAIKSTLTAFNTTVEGLVQRLDRQADALRSLSASYAQRETELASLVEGLARLRAYPAPAPAPTDRL